MSTPLPAQPHDRPEQYNEAAVIASNAALGSLTVLVGYAVRGKTPTLSKVAQGAIAGTGVYAGKFIAADKRWYSGIAGRQVASVGSSAIQNVATGRGFADRLLLPWGPLRFHVDRTASTVVRAKVDAAGVIATVVGIAGDDLELDLGKTLQYGAVVLKKTGSLGDLTAIGSHVGGVIKYRLITAGSVPASDEEVTAVMAHELVHVAQSDFLFNAWASPVESHVLGKSSLGRILNRYVDLGVHVPFAALLNSAVDYPTRPWEREAVTLVKAAPGQ